MRLNNGIIYSGVSNNMHRFSALIIDRAGNYFKRFSVMGNKKYAFKQANQFYKKFKLV
jgi:hypothetical protein